MNVDHIKAVSVFFFLTMKDNRTAVRTSHRAVRELAKLIKGSGEVSEDLIVRVTEKHRLRPPSSLFVRRTPEIETPWFLPNTVNLGAWLHFLKDIQPENANCVIWSKILGFSDDSIARGLGIAVGNVRYRVATGLRALGRVLYEDELVHQSEVKS